MKRKLLSISILYIATMLAGIGVNAQITNWTELYDALQNGGEVTLTQDITYSGTKGALVVPDSKTVTLDLNGFTINRALTAKTSSGNVITVNGTLTIKDNSGKNTGKITGGWNSARGGGIINNGTLILENGSICGNRSDVDNVNVTNAKDTGNRTGGAGVYNNGTMSMNGGSISGNISGNYGGGVLNQGSKTFTINGGLICENTAENSGGGIANFGLVVQNDGQLFNNSAKNGGGVYNMCDDSAEGYKMEKGFVYSNVAKGRSGSDPIGGSGGGFYIGNDDVNKNAKYYIKPGCGVYGNLALDVSGKSGKADEIGQSNDKSVFEFPKVEEMIFSDGSPMEGYWYTDGENARFRNGKGTPYGNTSVTGKVYLAVGAPCSWCALQDKINEAADGSTIILTQDYLANIAPHKHNQYDRDADYAFIIPAGKALTIDLNGHTIDRNLAGREAIVNGNVFTVAEGASLTIKDSSMDADNPYGKGIITGGNHSSEGGAIYNDGSFVLENGNITGNHTTDIGGALFNAGELLMKNGSISGNITDYCGGGLVNKGILTVTGGIITGNKALGTEYGGGGIYNDEGCTVTISNCTISSNQGDLGGAIQNMGMGTVTMTNSEIADNIARLNGNGIFQMGVMNLGSGNTFGKDQIVYLPAGADADHKSQYVITKVGNFTGTVPIKLENEVIGRDILVSKTGATSSTEGKVVDSDLGKLLVTLSGNKYLLIYSPTGLDGDVEPKDVIELSIGVLITKSGLKAGESAAFSVYEKGKPAKAVNIILTGVDNEGTAVSQAITIAFNATEITVKELPWSWAYNASGSTEITQDITSSNGNVFTFTNVEKENTPLRDEAIKNNAIINARSGVTVNEWEKEKRKL